MREAGSAFDLIRRAIADHQPEPQVFEDAIRLLDELDRGLPPRPSTLAFKVRLLTHCGVWPQLDLCVRCGRSVPEEKAALVDPIGGAVCRACGGASLYLRASVRGRLIAFAKGQSSRASEPMTSDELDEAQALVEAVSAHFLSGG